MAVGGPAWSAAGTAVAIAVGGPAGSAAGTAAAMAVGGPAARGRGGVDQSKLLRVLAGWLRQRPPE
eukprot:6847915-Alexandrium_andersonii.AAC.1